MGEHLLIDGFNFFHRWRETASFFGTEEDLPGAVDRALRLLALRFHERRARPVVVLDGDAPAGRRHGLTVRYAGALGSADAAILQILRRSGAPRNACVVTDDRELGTGARALGASVQSVAAYARALPAPAGAPAEAEKPPLPGEREVAQWLAIFGDGSDVLREEG